MPEWMTINMPVVSQPLWIEVLWAVAIVASVILASTVFDNYKFKDRYPYVKPIMMLLTCVLVLFELFLLILDGRFVAFLMLGILDLVYLREATDAIKDARQRKRWNQSHQQGRKSWIESLNEVVSGWLKNYQQWREAAELRKQVILEKAKLLAAQQVAEQTAERAAAPEAAQAVPVSSPEPVPVTDSE